MNSKKTKLQIILSHTFTYFNLLNLVLAGLIFISGQYRNMLFMGIVVANSLIGIIQELKVKKLIDALSVITATKARRMIDGKIEEIMIDDLQVGDVVQVVVGDQIAADSEVLTSDGLELNESLLTGESNAVQKNTGDTLFSGSHIVAGSGTARIVHVGDDNYATQLVKKAQTKKRATSEMQDAIKRIIKYVSYAIVPIGLILFYIQMHDAGETLSDGLVGTVAGVLGMIPEGLVLLTSVSFILGVGRLARKKALVQEMEAIEALARVNILCLDKTGTITTGELTVDSILSLNMKEHEINNITGNLIHAFSESNATSDALKKYFPKTTALIIQDTIPFSSKRKYMGACFDGKGSFVLGAPEFICHNTQVLAQADKYARKGLRVLLLASCHALVSSPEQLQEVVPHALIILSDCMKPDVQDTFSFFKKQGVAIKVISGDNPATVSTVAMRAGVDGAEHFVDANTLPENPEERSKVIEQCTVFGRVSPETKQMIIKAYESKGHIVGMVGDGVNDVLALKDADCGIAMANGADAAKQSAHIVLLDSDFTSMKNIVKEGRTIIANIERVSALYLTKTIYSVLLCVLFIFLGKTYPFTPIQLSLIGATAIGIPSFILTLEQHEEVTSTGFLKHVLRISLPCALSLVGVLLGIAFLSLSFGFSETLTSTLNMLAGGIVSLSVVLFVCQPMTKRRFVLFIAVTTLFAIAFFCFPSFFGILPVFRFI